MMKRTCCVALGICVLCSTLKVEHPNHPPLQATGMFLAGIAANTASVSGQSFMAASPDSILEIEYLKVPANWNHRGITRPDLAADGPVTAQFTMASTRPI